MSRSRFSLRLAVVIVTAVVAATGCGVGPDNAPRALPDDVENPALAGTTPSESGNTPITVFYTGEDGRLVPVPRDAPSASIAAITEATLADPRSDEIDAGITTAIPPDTEVRSGTVRADGIVAIDLSNAFDQVGSASRAAAFAQIVLGISQRFDPTRSIRFSIGGEPTSVSTNAGAQPVVTACDFADRLPEVRQLDSDVARFVDVGVLESTNRRLDEACQGG